MSEQDEIKKKPEKHNDIFKIEEEMQAYLKMVRESTENMMKDYEDFEEIYENLKKKLKQE